MMQACPQCQTEHHVGSLRPGDSLSCEACHYVFRVQATRYGSPFGPPPAHGSERSLGREIFPPAETTERSLHAAREKARRPSLTVDGYDVVDILGKGGMGQVYRAIQKSLGREVAIKTLDPNLARNQASVMRFTKEAAAMARLHHPNIVYVIDRGFCRQRHFFVMEFIDGPSLRDMLHDGPFSPIDALQIISDLARTMAYAHSQGVIHRDLKPENLLYTKNNVLKVADFGLAGVNEETTHIRKLTRSFVSMGTECYMAPEQRRDAKNVDHRADLYSIGVLLYELLTQQLPFPHLPSPETPIIPGHPKIDAIIRRCLETSPLKRFDTTEDLCKALQDAMPTPSLLTSSSDVRDTVAETEAMKALPSEPPPPSKRSFGRRLSEWPSRISQSLAKFSSQSEPSLAPHNLGQWAWSGGLILLLALAVAAFFFFSPAPPIRDAQGQAVMIPWDRLSATPQTISDQEKRLHFDFLPAPKRGLLQGSPASAWKLQGHWSSREGILRQNTYQHTFRADKAPVWALYEGHRVSTKGLLFEATASFEIPRIPEGSQILSLKEYFKRSGLEPSSRQPSLGIGLQTDRRVFALLLKRLSRGIAARLIASPSLAALHTESRKKDPSSESHLMLSSNGRSPLKLRLAIREGRLTASVEEQSLPSIALSSSEIPKDGHIGFLCRDAHCVFSRHDVKSSSIHSETERHP